jgi:hypothetical protein
MGMEKKKHRTVYLDWIPVEVTYTPAGQTYEIYVDAIIKASVLSAPKATFNIQKTADIGAEGAVSQQSTFNIEKTAIIRSDSDILSQGILNISKTAEVKVDAVFSFQITFNLYETASINAVAQPHVKRFLSFEISLSLQQDLRLGLRHTAFEVAMTLQHAKVSMGIMPMYRVALRILKVSQ